MPTEEEFKKYLVINKGLDGNTLRTYLCRFRIFNKWLKKHNLRISKETVVQFLYEQKQKGYANTSINTYRHTLVHLDKYFKYKDLPHGYTTDIDSLPKTHPEIETLTKAELDMLLFTKLVYSNRNGVDCSTLDEKYLALTHFLALTGCRIDEATSLQIKRLDIEKGKAYLINTKNKENRSIFFGKHPYLKEILTKLIKDRNSESLVFTGSTGNKVLNGVFNDNLRLRAETAGILNTERIHAHVLRHTFATDMLKSGVDITIVSKLLGHKDIRVTYETYIHILDDTLQQAIKKHPLLKPFVDEQELVEELKDILKKLNFGGDKRFKYAIEEGNGSFKLELNYNQKYSNVQIL